MSGLEADLRFKQDDDAILEDTKKLCETLGISPFKFNPYRIEWAEWPTGFWSRPTSAPGRLPLADSCNIDPSLVTLPRDLRGKLSPEDWRPLIASGLFYRYKLGGVRKAIFAKTLLPVALVFIALAIPYLLTIGPFFIALHCSGGGCGIIVLPVFIPAAALALLLASPSMRRTRLRADIMASQLVGSQILLGAFRKIELIDVRSVEGLKRPASRLSFEPTLTERIENLANPQT